MANWCNNMVAFEGSTEAIKQVTELFKAMAEKEKTENAGQLPDFIKDDDGYFFHIDWDEEDEGFFRYETRWSPNIVIVKKIAERLHLNFTYDYEELGFLVFGRAIYKDGVLNDVCLADVDFEAYHYDEKADNYLFEGKTYETEFPILEILLERKIKELIL